MSKISDRLVGAIILGCLAIIFIPIILDGEGVKVPDTINKMPPSPELPTQVRIEASRPVIIADTPEIELVPVVTKVKADVPLTEVVKEIENDHQPMLDSRGLPKGWSVQLASFGEIDNANKLVTKLLKTGHKAYTKKLRSTSQGMLTAVMVGPVLTQKDAAVLIDILFEEVSLTGIVVKFSIDKDGD